MSTRVQRLALPPCDKTVFSSLRTARRCLLPLLSYPVVFQFQSAFQSLGIVTALNEPWSAKDGFMYAADQFSSPHTAVLMFEFRQDLLVQEEWRAKVVQQTEKVLREAGHK